MPHTSGAPSGWVRGGRRQGPALVVRCPHREWATLRTLGAHLCPPAPGHLKKRAGLSRRSHRDEDPGRTASPHRPTPPAGRPSPRGHHGARLPREGRCALLPLLLVLVGCGWAVTGRVAPRCVWPVVEEDAAPRCVPPAAVGSGRWRARRGRGDERQLALSSQRGSVEVRVVHADTAAAAADREERNECVCSLVFACLCSQQSGRLWALDAFASGQLSPWGLKLIEPPSLQIAQKV